MFRFLHAADLHLDSPLRGLARYESAPAEILRGASRRAFVNLVDLAIAERVAFVLLAGDLYDGDWKDYSTGIFLSQHVGRLRDHNIPVFAVAGNHDAANKITRALELPSNMTILSATKPQSLRLKDLNVAIHGQSFETQHIAQNLAADYPAAINGAFNIGMLHTSLDGRQGHATYAPCTVDELRARSYQYWALGHVHAREIVSTSPWIVYPGCTQGRHIRETGAKGCSLVTVDDELVLDVEHRVLDVLRWEVCAVDLDGAESIEEALHTIHRAMAKVRSDADGRPVAMRVALNGACTIANALRAFPTKLEHQLRALAADISAEDLWIEKIVVSVTPRLNKDEVLGGDTALAQLLRDIHALPNSLASIEGLGDTLEKLRLQLPPEALDPATGIDLHDDQVLADLVAEAKEMLIGRLLDHGGDA